MPIYEENRFLTLKGDEIGPDCQIPGLTAEFNNAGTGLILGSHFLLYAFGSKAAALLDVIAGMGFADKGSEQCILFDNHHMSYLCIDTRPDKRSEPNSTFTPEEIEYLARGTAKRYKALASLTATGIATLPVLAPFLLKDGVSTGENVLMASTYLSGALYKSLEGARIYKNVAEKKWDITNWPTPAAPHS